MTDSSAAFDRATGIRREHDGPIGGAEPSSPGAKIGLGASTKLTKKEWNQMPLVAPLLTVLIEVYHSNVR